MGRVFLFDAVQNPSPAGQPAAPPDAPVPYVFTVPAVDFSQRSPFAFANTGQTPVAPDYAPVRFDTANGVPSIAGTALEPFHGAGPQGNAPPQASFDTGKYANSVIFAVTFTGAGLPVDANGQPINFVLPRPNNTRVLLTVQNQTVAGLVFYAWDAVASNVACMQIPMNGSLDRSSGTVPQGNLSLFATGAGTVLVEYANANIKT